MKIKKITSIIISFALIASVTVSAATQLESETTSTFTLIPNGLEITTQEEYMNHCISTADNSNADPSSVTPSYASSVDLSTSQYFPPIITQGNVGSCAAFSTTYYQFTYEANKLNSITTTASNAYSPQWTYYYMKNDSANTGMSVKNAYSFIIEHGGLKLSDYPYNTSFDSSIPLPTDIDDMREALNTRISSWDSVYISGSGTPIQGVNDSDLNILKELLTAGKILQVSSYFNFNNATVNGELINYRCTYNNTGHSFVIVGYNDNISYDVNGNGTIEDNEKGAFKIANSWGTSYGNNGFAWVLYDALNSVTGISGNWEANLSGTRKPAFLFGTDDNWFSAINVSNYDVKYIAKLDFSNVNMSYLNISLTRKTGSSATVSYNVIAPRAPITKTFTLLFDYNNIERTLPFDITGNTWGINLTGNAKTISSGSIIDNYGNTIATLSYSSSGKYTAPINLMRGDINYDGVLSNKDVLQINRYCANWNNLSNVQIYLADFNADGVVNLKDSSALTQYIANNP